MAYPKRLCILFFTAALVRIESSPPPSGRAPKVRRAQNANACESVNLTVKKERKLISSPGYPGYYPNDTTCDWKLKAASGKRINISSNFINVELSPGCQFDHVIIYDGDSELSDSLGKYCGNTPISLITSSNTAMVKMVSDGSYTGMGFELSYSTTTSTSRTRSLPRTVYCNTTIQHTSGQITSPSFPLPSHTSTYCQYTFKAPQGKRVELVFNFFKLERSTSCQFDKLDICDGLEAACGTKNLGPYCGHDQPPLIRSSGRYLSLTYTTDSSYKRGGFNVSYQFVSPDQNPFSLNEGHSDCSQLITNETMLSSPGYPAFYPNNKACVHVLRAPLYRFVKITFEAFKMETSKNCALDSLAIYDGSSEVTDPSDVLCGEQVLPGRVFSSKGREYRLTFKSDYSLTDIGFLLNVTFPYQKTGAVCGTRRIRPGRRKRQKARIIGGQKAQSGSYPWFALFYDTKYNTSFCGGSIINSKWIVTAAHCISDERGYGDCNNQTWFSKKTTKIMVGTNYCNGLNGKELTAGKIIIHPGYIHSSYYDNDIALVRVKEVIDFTSTVQPICLESQTFNDEEFIRKFKSGYVAGCGLTKLGITPQDLREVNLPIESRQVCKKSLENTSSIMTENMFCAGFSKANQRDSCSGDSGGGFVVESGDRFLLVGVVSWGIGCDKEGQYGFYTDVGRFFNWIHKTIDFRF